MLKATGRSDRGKPLLIFGLSWRNLDMLREGKPIEMTLAEFGMPDVEVLIVSGETELHIAKKLGIQLGPPPAAANDPIPQG